MARPRTRVVLSVLVLASGFLLLLYLESHPAITQSSAERDATPAQVEKPNSDLVADNRLPTITQMIESECVSLEKFIQSPDAYKLDEWFLSWGAPPIANSELLSRPYSKYGVEVLESLATGGDSVAMHELGLDLVWSALSDMNALPDYKTLWDLGDEENPHASTVDRKKLQLGRDYLYQAAINGQTYALVEIGLSYSHERVIGKKNGGLSETEERQLQVNAYGYGESTEMLIQGLHSTFYQASISPDAHSDGAYLVTSVTSDVQAERRSLRSMGSLSQPVVDSVPEELDFCIEAASPQ